MPKCVAIQFCGSQRTLPNDGHTPSSCHQRGNGLLIVFAVALNLRSPKLCTCRWPFEETATMAMPEAPMHQNNSLVLRQNNVRHSGQVLDVQPKPEATRVQQATDENFRVCVSAPDAGHHAASGVLVYNVRHGIKCSVDIPVAVGSCAWNNTRSRLEPSRPVKLRDGVLQHRCTEVQRPKAASPSLLLPSLAQRLSFQTVCRP